MACIGIYGVARSGKSSIANALSSIIASFHQNVEENDDEVQVDTIEQFLMSDAAQSCTMGLQVPLFTIQLYSFSLKLNIDFSDYGSSLGHTEWSETSGIGG